MIKRHFKFRTTTILFLVFAVLITVTLIGCGERKSSKSPEGVSLKDLPKSSLPDMPLRLPDGSNQQITSHNDEGISHYREGHYKVALKHFRDAEQVDPEQGEVQYNIALALKNMGDHGSALQHFQKAKQHANGNAKILASQLFKDAP